MYIQVTQKLTTIEQALISWIRDHLKQDVQHLVNVYACKFSVQIPQFKLSQEKQTWGSYSKDEVICINWQLADTPVSVLEYAVAHEVVHLLHRNHGDGFWQALSCVMPDWRTRKAQLESWDGRR